MCIYTKCSQLLFLGNDYRACNGSGVIVYRKVSTIKKTKKTDEEKHKVNVLDEVRMTTSCCFWCRINVTLGVSGWILPSLPAKLVSIYLDGDLISLQLIKACIKQKHQCCNSFNIILMVHSLVIGRMMPLSFPLCTLNTCSCTM